MNLINYISIIAVPLVIIIILLYGLFERQNIFDLFTKGAEGGFKTTIKLIPSLIGLFLAIGALSCSGILDFITSIFSPIFKFLNIPPEIIPLALLRPISGSGSIAIATEIMQKNGVDSKIGLISATIMGATETTLYILTLYTSTIKVKKIRFVLFAALMADLTGIIVSIIFWNACSI